MNIPTHTLIGYALWFLVAAAWMIVLRRGMDADKPLGSRLPGQGTGPSARPARAWDDEDDALSDTAAWVLFGVVCVLLPLVLYWVFVSHG